MQVSVITQEIFYIFCSAGREMEIYGIASNMKKQVYV
jgi:hypothetical protein